MIRWLLALLLLLVSSPALANSLILDATTKALEAATSTTASTDYIVSYVDITTTAMTPGLSHGNITTATTTTILAAPGASTQRQVKWISIRNRSTTAAQVVSLKLDVSASEFHIGPDVSLAPGEALRVAADGKLTLLTATGIERQQSDEQTGVAGKTYPFRKNGGAKDSAGYWYGFMKDAGTPGASVPGAPGLNGWTTDCSTATNAAEPAGAEQVGAHVLTDPATGNLYLTHVAISGIAEPLMLIDVLWYNTGLAVTTTTAQTVTFPGGGLPARDLNGATSGRGVGLALYSTAANTNAGVISTTTASYTDAEGNAGATATFAAVVGAQAPATPVIGTWMPFLLAAGDTGIRSVQSITLGTSYGAGSLSAYLYRELVTIPNSVAAVAGTVTLPPPGIRIYPNSCIAMVSVGQSGANLLAGSYTITEK